MTTTLSGPDQMRAFNLLQHLYALKVQRDTGLKHSKGSVLNSARDRFGVKSRTIAGAIEELEAQYKEMTGE